jgi:hypothetical protein
MVPLATLLVPLENPRCARSWFHNVLTYGGEVIEYLTIFLLKNHLNRNKKIIREFGHTFDIIGKLLVSRI